MYLTLFLSEVPVIPSGSCIIRTRIERQVPDTIMDYPVEELKTYLNSLAEVLETDVSSRVATSTPQSASTDETPSSD